jgi:hypothetical protein
MVKLLLKELETGIEHIQMVILITLIMLIMKPQKEEMMKLKTYLPKIN